MKNNNISISQPMLFPWYGMFEQILISDIFIFYNDVQFSKGSFVNRVQIKTSDGIKWLTIPLKKFSLGAKINEIEINDEKDWKNSHIEFLKNTYKMHPYKNDVLEIVRKVYDTPTKNLYLISQKSISEILKYLGIKKEFQNSFNLKNDFSGSERVYEIVKHYNSKCYITGHGAKNYLNHSYFQQNNIDVQYMSYSLSKYNQRLGEFTPYVSILDLIANEGKNSISFLKPKTINWRNFINEPK